MSNEDQDTTEESVREAIERSQHGAPAAGEVLRDQFETHEVFQRIVAAADEEATTGTRELFFSSLAAGFAITITYLLYASLYAATDGAAIVSTLLYPLGFVFIILGGYQLYTENTLPPVVLVLERLMSLPRLLSIWATVVLGNFVGGAMGAFVLANTGVFSGLTATAAENIALKGIETPATDLFFKAMFAGLIVAGVVWVVYAVTDNLTRLVVVYLSFLAIPTADLFHVVVSFTEVMYLVFMGRDVLVAGLFSFVLPVLLGNTVGGVALVTVVNYFQTTEERLNTARREGPDRVLSWREMGLGSLAGRSYVKKRSYYSDLED
jgi:formate/nitrite transporter FocA (FNT family)